MFRAHSSVVERCPDKTEVPGSIPGVPTITRFRGLFCYDRIVYLDDLASFLKFHLPILLKKNLLTLIVRIPYQSLEPRILSLLAPKLFGVLYA